MKNLHILATDKPSRLFRSELTNNLGLDKKSIIRGGRLNNQHIYIISDEEIKDGEWHLHYYEGKPVISKSHNSAVKVINEIAEQFSYKKVILTTDADLINYGVQEINDGVLEWFVKNPSCDEVEVELLEYGFDEVPICKYEIIIPKEEPKQETLEEAAFNFTAGKSVKEICSRMDFIKGSKFGAKWQKEQNKNLYSKKDMIEFADFYYQYKELIKLQKWEIIEISKEDVFKKWIEQLITL